MDHGHEELSRSLILNDDESGVGIARTVPRCLVMAVHYQHHHPSSSSTPLSVFFLLLLHFVRSEHHDVCIQNIILSIFVDVLSTKCPRRRLFFVVECTRRSSRARPPRGHRRRRPCGGGLRWEDWTLDDAHRLRRARRRRRRRRRRRLIFSAAKI